MIKTEDYKRWVYDHLLKVADLAIHPKVMALFEDANILIDKVKIKLSFKREIICETIASNTNDPVSETPHKRSQYNQQERGIPNNFGNTRDKLYRNVLQDWLS